MSQDFLLAHGELNGQWMFQLWQNWNIPLKIIEFQFTAHAVSLKGCVRESLSIFWNSVMWTLVLHEAYDTSEIAFLCIIFVHNCNKNVHFYPLVFELDCLWGWGHFQHRDYMALVDGVPDERWIGKDLEGSSHGLIEVLSWYLPGGLRKTMKILSQEVWIASVTAKIRIESLLNTSQGSYHYANLFGDGSFPDF
jgi:hypothetical protein